MRIFSMVLLMLIMRHMESKLEWEQVEVLMVQDQKAMKQKVVVVVVNHKIQKKNNF